MKGSIILAETRPQFLVLSVVLGLLGAAVAGWLGSFDPAATVLATAGLVALHIAVNVFNDWCDMRSGIDLAAPRTPFSGGSGVLPAGGMSLSGALILAAVALVAGCAAGVVLWVWKGEPVLWLGVFGLAAVVGYNTVFSKVMLGEIVTGLALGSLPVLGLVYVNTMAFPAAALAASVPSGLLVFNLLLLNEFPDAGADRAGGRRHVVTVFGPVVAARVYVLVCGGAFAWVAAGVVAGVFPSWAALALLSLPAAVVACQGALRHGAAPQRLLPAQAANVIVTLAFQSLFAAGFLIEILLRGQ
jgi:1,4-dihydroxy-2-naphthoate polyprenyltransferase